MKTTKTILALVFLLISSVSYAQNSLYNKYSSMSNVSATYISKAMLEMQPTMYMDQIYISSISKQLDNVYILQTSDQSIRTTMQDDIDKYIKQGKFELLMEKKTSQDNASSFYIKRKNKEEIKEVVMVTTTRSTRAKDKPVQLKFVLLVGDMTIKDIQRLTLGNMSVSFVQSSLMGEWKTIDLSTLKDGRITGELKQYLDSLKSTLPQYMKTLKESLSAININQCTTTDH